jgi:hypothetical protein
MPDKSQKVELLKRLTHCSILVDGYQERYSIYLENKYTGKNLPSWMNSNGPTPNRPIPAIFA